ncbi:hypothetical protein GCM10017778_01080 [Streptomyces vinaceus]|nr:hypothetical protein GCM10017778_01080 [Streptomyces vinaceus]
MDGGQRQTAGGRELAEADLAPGVGHAFKQIEGALKGLNATAGGGGLRGSVGGAGAGRRHGAVLSVLAGKEAAYRSVGVGPRAGAKPSPPVRWGLSGSRTSSEVTRPPPGGGSYILDSEILIPSCGNIQLRHRCVGALSGGS